MKIGLCVNNNYENVYMLHNFRFKYQCCDVEHLDKVLNPVLGKVLLRERLLKILDLNVITIIYLYLVLLHPI